MKIHGASETVEDVFFQIFGHTPDANENKTFARPGKSETSVRDPGDRFRAWNLNCQLYRQYDPRDSFSKPWVELHIPDVFLSNQCKFQDKYFSAFQLQLRISFHLKPHVLDSSLDEAGQMAAAAADSSEGPIQMFVSRVLEDETRAISGQVFADAKEMISDVRDAVLASLGSSSLAPLVDFHHIEVTAIGPKYERLVTNKLLNANGTLKDSRISSGDDSRACNTVSSRGQVQRPSENADLGGTSTSTTEHRYSLGSNPGGIMSRKIHTL